jgi:glycosyltransferase involved in cell wall biosynthesis
MPQSNKPKILFVCPCWPVDRTHGGQLRALHIGRALKECGDVSVVVVSPTATWPDANERTAAEFRVVGEVDGAIVGRGFTDRIRRTLNPRFINVHALLASEEEQRRIYQLAEAADIVWFLKLRSANILNRWHWPHSVMDIDDVPSTYSRTVSATAEKAIERARRRLHVWIERRRERLLLERFTVLSVCSEIDRRLLGFAERLHVIPNGFERPTEAPIRNPASPPLIGFMGLFNYAPNCEGVQWFVDNCWPRIKEEFPGIRLRLVGTGTDGPQRPNDAAVDALGWIAEPSAEVASWSLMIVPIHTGAGTRIKLVDAFSRKCPVVSTAFGALGYDVENGRELLIADTPRAFADACISLIRDRVSALRIAERAYNTFLDKWTWEAIAPQVWAVADECLRLSKSPQSFMDRARLPGRTALTHNTQNIP